MAKAISNKNVVNAKFKVADFTGKWLASFGKPELRGAWIIYGESGGGKTHVKTHPGGLRDNEGALRGWQSVQVLPGCMAKIHRAEIRYLLPHFLELHKRAVTERTRKQTTYFI